MYRPGPGEKKEENYMDNTYKVILVDDNKEFCELLKGYLNKREDLEVVGIGYNGEEGIELVKNKGADVLILDLIMPHLDGIGVLEAMKKEHLDKEIKTIVLTAFGQENITQRVVSLGIDYYIMKPFDLDKLVDRIRQLFQSQISDTEDYIIKNEKDKPDDESPKDLSYRISEILHELGVPAHIKGYLYLRKAIELVVNDVDYLGAITKKLYPDVADYFDTTSSRVERAIRHALEVAWKNGNEAELNKYFSSTVAKKNDKPTNSQFVAKIADEIRLEIK